MRITNKLVLAATAAITAIPMLAYAAPATATEDPSSAPTLRLPESTGPYPVSSQTLHLVDEGRPDPWVPESGDRELMVSMFYPSLTRHGEQAEYMTPAESNAFIDGQRRQGTPIPKDFPDKILSSVHTDITSGSFPAPKVGGRPLIVLSPGFSLSRSSLTGLASDLASDGYVVAAVDHSYESFGIEMPDGNLVTCEACDVKDYSKVPPGRSQDVSFVLDRLLATDSPWRYSWMIDEDDIGMAGHSIGGNSTASTMTSDPRIDAGVNMDGTFFEPIDGKLHRPFMMIGTERMHTPDGDESWPRDWKKLEGEKYWLTVAGSGHFSFLDYPVLTDQLGLPNPGPLTGKRSMEITRTYVDAFFDEHVRGWERPVLDGPSQRFEEVAFHGKHDR